MDGPMRLFPLVAVAVLAACGQEQQQADASPAAQQPADPNSSAQQFGTPAPQPKPDCQALDVVAGRLRAEADTALAVFWRYREDHVEPAQERWLAKRERGRPAGAERREVDRVTAENLRLQREQQAAESSAARAEARALACKELNAGKADKTRPPESG